MNKPKRPAFLKRLEKVDFRELSQKGSYVYCYISKKGQPYYVGVSKGPDRPIKRHNFVQVPPDRRFIVVLRSELTVQESLAWEKFFIKHYGRRDLGTGILYNRNNGGDTFDGVLKETPRQRETRCANASKTKVIKNAHKYGQCPLLWFTAGEKERSRVRRRIGLGYKGEDAWKRGYDYSKQARYMKNRVVSLETRAKMSSSQLGKKWSEERIVKRKITMLLKKLHA